MKYFALVSLFFVLNNVYSQVKFCNSFDCDKAAKFLNTYNDIFRKAEEKYGISKNELFSIISPEFVVYNEKRDLIETRAAEFLYAKFGSVYGDFSIGFFQMKPKFVEKIIKEILQDTTYFSDFLFIAEFPDESNKNSIIINRIKDIYWSVDFLSAFYKVAMKKYPEINKLPEKDRIRYLASAYNLGIPDNFSLVKEWIYVEKFPNDFISRSKFSYANSAWEIFVKLDNNE